MGSPNKARDTLPCGRSAPIAGPKREFYSVEEVARMVNKAKFTVRQWCLNGQVNAVKRVERRGGSSLWAISAEEVTRYFDSGLLPKDMRRNDRN